MNINWALTRAMLYGIGILFGLLGVWAAGKGFAVYDEATNTIDLLPISLDMVLSFFTQVLPSGVALTALVKGWRK